MQLEVDVSTIFAKIIREGTERGVFKEVDADLMSYNIMMLAHMWALKRWHFKDRLSISKFVDLQTETVIAARKK